MSSTSETDDLAQAFLNSYKLAQQGDVEAQFQTGLCYAQGKGVAQNYRNAAFYWLNAAKQSHSDAQAHLGILFEKGLGFPQDFQKAKQCYQSAIDQGNAEAKVRLAVLYLKGLGIKQDIKKAISLFIQAAEQGEATAQYNLGAAYEKGIGGLTQNTNLAYFWYQQAANQQQPQAQKILQSLQQNPQLDSLSEKTLRTQHLPTVDATTALQSSVIEDCISSYQVSNFSDEDIPVNASSDVLFTQAVSVLKNDIKTAFKEFEQAANMGHAKAQYNMGLASLYGLGGNKVCTDTALGWLQKSAEQGYRPAYLVLGWLYQGGMLLNDNTQALDDSVIIDHDTAINYYEMASELGNPQAQYFLAQIFATGNGVTANEQKSLAWFKQSAKQGYTAAFKHLEKINHLEK